MVERGWFDESCSMRVVEYGWLIVGVELRRLRHRQADPVVELAG